jgi:hypothetical protein
MKPVGLFLLAMVTKMAEATPLNDTLGQAIAMLLKQAKCSRAKGV